MGETAEKQIDLQKLLEEAEPLSQEAVRDRSKIIVRNAGFEPEEAENTVGHSLWHAATAFAMRYGLDPLLHVDVWFDSGKVTVRPNYKGVFYYTARSGRVHDARFAIHPPGTFQIRDSKGNLLGEEGDEKYILPESQKWVGEYELRFTDVGGKERHVFGWITQAEWQTSTKGSSNWGSRPLWMFRHVRLPYRAYLDNIGMDVPSDIELTPDEERAALARLGNARIGDLQAKHDLRQAKKAQAGDRELERLDALAGKEEASKLRDRQNPYSESTPSHQGSEGGGGGAAFALDEYEALCDDWNIDPQDFYVQCFRTDKHPQYYMELGSEAMSRLLDTANDKLESNG